MPAPRTSALLIALLLLAPAVLLTAGEAAERVYRAEGLFKVKQEVGLHKAWWMLRPLWAEKPMGEGVCVAVIDTGADASHPDLAGAVVLWRDFAGDADGRRHDTPYDDHGHGTHVSGIIAGRGHPQLNPMHAYWVTGLTGVAPESHLLVAKAMRHDGTGSDATVANAIRWAMAPEAGGPCGDGADVINLSIGLESEGTLRFGGFEDETTRAVRDALESGVYVVVSSGNGGGPNVSDPGNVPGVITVGALESDERVAAFSNGGDGLDLVAPGVLVSTFPRHLDGEDYARDGYAGLAGTSMAAPVVTGVIARMIESDPSLAQRQPGTDHTSRSIALGDLLRANAKPIEGEPADRSGAGVLDAYASIRAVDRGTREIDPLGAALTLLIGAGGAFTAVRVYRLLRPVRSPRPGYAEDP